MSNAATVNDLFDMAIKAEKAAEEVYRRLQAKFAPYPDAARFWRDYAAAEAGHALWLERVRDALNPEQLSVPADPQTVSAAQRLLLFRIEGALKDIKDLEAAYQLANELESGETNVVFDFLITHFATDAQAQSFIRSQLNDHVAKISTGFPARFRSSASRLSIKATE